MLALLSPRLWLALALVAGLSFSHFFMYRKGSNAVRSEWLVSVASANEEARRLEQARQSAADAAGRLAAKREAGIRADAVRARNAADGLRDDLSAARDYAAQSRAAAEQTARVATGLFGQCTARYLGVAEDAARADSEARELREGWPK